MGISPKQSKAVRDAKIRLITERLMKFAGVKPERGETDILKSRSPRIRMLVTEAKGVVKKLAEIEPSAALPAPQSPANVVPAWLSEETFAVQHNPLCVKPVLVRLIGHLRGQLDLLPYVGLSGTTTTKDALGFGMTIEEAATNAKTMRANQKSTFLSQLDRPKK
jgi:hypothetical protein